MNAKGSLAWSYGRRVIGLIVGVVAGAAAVAGGLAVADSRDYDGSLARTAAAWWSILGVLVVVAITLLATRTFSTDSRANPEKWLRHGWLRWVTLAVAVVPVVILGGWATPKSGPSIVRLELAGSAREAAKISYDSGVLEAALRADCAFIASYVLLLVFLTRWAGCYYRLERLRRARVALSFAILGAGAFDLLENGLMALGDNHSWWEKRDLTWEIAATCAWAKFAIVFVAAVYVCGGVWAWLFTPPWVRKASWALPEAAPASDDDSTATRRSDKPFGIALSGGGIRASSISLGALQVLEGGDGRRHNFGWDSASVVTAVSGGSNMAAGFSLARSYYDTEVYGAQDRLDPPATDVPGAERPPETLRTPWSMQSGMTLEEEHLFANLGYLLASSPRATADSSEAPATDAEIAADDTPAAKSQTYRPSAIATVLAGFLLNAAVLSAFLWVLVTPFGWLLSQLNDGPLNDKDHEKLLACHNLVFPGLALVAAGVLLVMVWVLLGQFLSRDVASNTKKQGLFRSCMYAGYGSLALGIVLLVGLYGLPKLAGWLDSGVPTFSGTAAGLGGVLGAAARIVKKPGAKFAPYIGGAAFIVFATLIAGLWTGRSASMKVVWSSFLPGEHQQSGWWWVIVVVLLVAVQLFFSPERWSLAAFYRGKLRIGYATYRTDKPCAPGEVKLSVYQNDNATSDKHLREPWLHSFRQAGRPSTPLTVCATATVSSRSVKTHYGIPALSVTFDPQHVAVHVPTSDHGSWSVHQAPTEVINAMGAAGHKRVTTMLAVAIASAAVSPAMGRIKIGPTRMLLAFANIRLGVWMPNPRYANAYVDGSADPGPMTELSHENRVAQPIGYPPTGLGYLFKEFLGIHDLSDPYVYMTDGGHWENTGLVEMLRRKDIQEVVCIDADCGSLVATSSLGKAMDLAPLECDVHIQANLDPLRSTASVDGRGYSVRTTTVGFFRRGSEWDNAGVIWYSKPGLTKDMPASMLGYRETHPDYPTITTNDQFFDSSTYIAYRELGRYNGRQILAARNALVDFLAEIRVTKSRKVLGSLDKALKAKQHWAVDDLVHAMHFVIGEKHKVAFLQGVARTLAGTTAKTADPIAADNVNLVG
ncbi:hypothetical protein [Aeromicrobium sp. Root236]|uniref:hypothetical protein n=1 Tax=Aeromicrobium sp. Root236 TaxID=1736498 RepID=UPI000AB0C617|nr:hypothetical protein [Aeromicrobium sp. Root236]